MLRRIRYRANGGAWQLTCARAGPMTGRRILTAEAMRAAEQAAIDAGTSVAQLMERAGAALAEAAYRFAGPLPALILCGPGNNGGDGYVAARYLAERGIQVRVAALAEPASATAQAARAQWDGAVEPLTESTEPAPLLIDALFGTGLKRGLDEPAAQHLSRLCSAAVARVARSLIHISEPTRLLSISHAVFCLKK